MEEKLKFLLNLQLFGEDDENIDPDEIEDEKKEQTDEEKKAEEEKKKAEQTRQQNAIEAQKRREREEKERKAREQAIHDKALTEGKLSVTKTNPYTDEPVVDEYDLEILEIQKKLEEEGKDPNADLPKRVAEIRRKKAKEAKEKLEQEEKDKNAINDDIKDFTDTYPDVDAKKLVDDPAFKDYSDGKLGNVPLKDIYSKYLTFKKKYKIKDSLDEEKEIEEKAKGAGATPNPSGGTKITKTPYSKMSSKEKEKYLREQGYLD